MFGLGLLVLYSSGDLILECQVVQLRKRKTISIETKYEIEQGVSEGVLKYPQKVLRI